MTLRDLPRFRRVKTTTTTTWPSASPIRTARASDSTFLFRLSSIKAKGSSKALMASSNRTRCFSKFDRAFFSSHSKPCISVYTIYQPFSQEGCKDGTMFRNKLNIIDHLRDTSGGQFRDLSYPKKSVINELPIFSLTSLGSQRILPICSFTSIADINRSSTTILSSKEFYFKPAQLVLISNNQIKGNTACNAKEKNPQRHHQKTS